MHHPEVAADPLGEVAAFLLAQEHGGAARPGADPADQRRVVGAQAVAVELDEIGRQPLDVVEGVGPLGVAGQLDHLPDAQGPRLALPHVYMSTRWASRGRSSTRGTTMSTWPCLSWKSAVWKSGGRSA